MKLRIKEIAKKKGISLSELSEKCGMAQSTISNIVTGKSSPALETLERIAIALGVSTVSLISDQITGYIMIEDEVHVITCVKDLEKVYKKLSE